MLRIGEFSKLSKTTIKTLRYYDEIGLLKPKEIDKFTKFRYYTTSQLFELHKIQSLRQIGLSIDEIKSIISGKDAKRIIDNRKKEIESEISEAKDKLSRLEFILSDKVEVNFMNYVATIKDIGGCIVYSKKMTVPSYDSYFQLIPAIGEKITKKYPDIKCQTPEYCFIVYLDNEYKEKDINVEFCEAVEQIKPDFDDIVFKRIEATKVVSVMHKGPYKDLSKAYAFAFKWVEENGYTLVDSPRENYIDGIWNKESEKDWLTELQLPIEKNNN